MRTRQPFNAISTSTALKSVFPESFKFVSDPTSNGYKYFNLLFGVELDQAKEYLQEIYNNSFLSTMDFGNDNSLYEVYLSGLSNQQYLNTTTSGITIKITNNGSPGGESEFWDGDPTRVVSNGIYSLTSNVITTGHITGVQYLRSNISGCGYLLVSTDLDQSLYHPDSGSLWRFDITSTGTLASYTGTWPGVFTQDYASRYEDEILQPFGSGYLSRKYPLSRYIRDDSGVYYWIDYYEPDHGWVRDPYWGVVAKVDYPGEFYYDTTGKKIYYRTAFNNPYGSGNFTTEYLTLRNVPISGTLKIYDLDILDISGNAIEIPSSGKQLYTLRSPDMLQGTGVADPQFDPIYVGYDRVVPSDSKFGRIAGLTGVLLLTTSWDYQRGSGYVDEGTMQWVEDSGDIVNQIKLVNPYSRYLVEYKYKSFNTAKYITSLEASRYIAYDTNNPIYSIGGLTSNEEEIPYEFTRDPDYIHEKAKYLTFDGWKIRPRSKMSRVDFNIPILIASGDANLQSFQQRETYIGYTSDFVPYYHAPKTYILDCIFDEPVITGSCLEGDLSGSGNYLKWFNNGLNDLYRGFINGVYGKSTRYVNNSGYYYINNYSFLKDNTFFEWDFSLPTNSNTTLMELSDASNNKYIKVEIKNDGILEITSNGTHIESRYKFPFNSAPKKLLIQTYTDRDYTVAPVFNVYVKDSYSFTKLDSFSEETDVITYSGTYLHVVQNSTVDISRFKIWWEDSTWQLV